MTQDVRSDVEIDWKTVYQSNLKSAPFSAAIWVHKSIDLFEPVKLSAAVAWV